VKQLADGVWQLSGFPPNAINVFVIEDVLIDASTRHATGRILRQVKGHSLSAHALTHAHPDHQGASHNVCEHLEIPFWVGDADADAAEAPDLIGERQPDHFIAQLFFKTCTGPGHPVDRKLAEGDRIGQFEVLHVPGHSAGHVAFWRESDRVLVAGDVFNSANPFTGIPGLRLPYDFFTPDPAENRRSAKRLGLLEPKLVLLGHGPPYRETRKFVDFCAALPD
jgi:glyoxylase-like metal-dependent hydrolase (beta-lactamase superfamily II)